MKGPSVAVVLSGKGKPSREPSGEVDLMEDEESEESEGSDPIDLFIESMGGTPSPEARKAFRLAVKSCSEGYEEE